jgi:3-dehydroquinate synthase
MSTAPAEPASCAADKLAPGSQRLHVDLGARGYDVLIGRGLVGSAGAFFAGAFGSRRAAIVTDRNVAACGHLAAVERSFADQPAKLLGSVVLAPGEATKCFAALEHTVGALLDLGLERRDLVIALGGGVIGDLGGFAAAVLRRGVRFVQIPTTLLAQVDSSVGGKTGINTRHGKNLVGAFHQPGLVLADADVLATLSDRHMRAGYAEIVKHAALGDATYFAWLERHGPAVLARQAEAVVHAVTCSVQMKAAIVARDETEEGDRMLLNLGHTFGHALEAWAGFSDRLLHGEAVALGTAIAFRFSEALGVCPSGAAERLTAHLTAIGLPTRIEQIPGGRSPTVHELLELMAQDKKVRDGRMTFVLVRDIGNAFVARDVERADVLRCLGRELEMSA